MDVNGSDIWIGSIVLLKCDLLDNSIDDSPVMQATFRVRWKLMRLPEDVIKFEKVEARYAPSKVSQN